MEYIERYLHQVERLLPEKDQEEVVKELREILEDEVNEKQAGDLSPEKLEKNQLLILAKFGRPESIAVNYGGGHSPLVPAELMPQFLKVLKILGVVYVIVFLGITVFLSRNPFDMVDGFIRNGLMNFAIVVIIFYFIGKDKKNLEKSWSPADLPPVQPKSNVNQSELFISISFTSFFIIWITMFPEWIGFGLSKDGGPFEFIPFAIEKIQPFLPFFVLLLIANVLIDIFTLIQRVWTPLLRAGNIALGLIWIFLANTAIHFGLQTSIGEMIPTIKEHIFNGDIMLYYILVGSMIVAGIDIITHVVGWARINMNKVNP